MKRSTRQLRTTARAQKAATDDLAKKADEEEKAADAGKKHEDQMKKSEAAAKAQAAEIKRLGEAFMISINPGIALADQMGKLSAAGIPLDLCRYKKCGRSL